MAAGVLDVFWNVIPTRRPRWPRGAKGRSSPHGVCGSYLAGKPTGERKPLSTEIAMNVWKL